MAGSSEQNHQPPQLMRSADGTIETGSLADLIEWFLAFDERTSRMRHPSVNELFLWKQSDDAANGVRTYPFENAEARFAIGVVQAIEHNRSEPLLGLWLNDILSALHDSRTTRMEIEEANKLPNDAETTYLQKGSHLTTNAERRLYLSSCWLETLYTAEARVLGWVYQEIYGRPFTPTSAS